MEWVAAAAEVTFSIPPTAREILASFFQRLILCLDLEQVGQKWRPQTSL